MQRTICDDLSKIVTCYALLVFDINNNDSVLYISNRGMGLLYLANLGNFMFSTSNESRQCSTAFASQVLFGLISDCFISKLVVF